MLTKLIDKITYLVLIRTCWRLAGDRKGTMVQVYAMFFMANAVALTQPLIVGKIVGAVATGGDHLLPNLFLWVAAMVANVSLFWCFHGPARVLERKFAFALRQRLTQKMYGQVMDLPWKWHQNHHSGDTLNRLNFAAQAVYDFADTQFIYLELCLRLFGGVLLLAWVAPNAGLIVGCAIPLLLFMINRFDRKLVILNALQNRAEHHLAAGLLDYMGNIATVLTLRLQRASRGEIAKRLISIGSPLNESIMINEGKWCLFTILLEITNAIAIIVYVFREQALATGLVIGTVVTILQYLRQISNSFNTFANFYQALMRYRVNMAGIDEIGKAHAEFAGPTHSEAPKNWHAINVAEIAFAYEDQAHNPHHLSGVSLDLARGKRIALVGESGSGKSTLLRLLRGLHEPDNGYVVIDGKPQMGLAALNQISTLVPQDAEIFENTIRYNITCGIDESASRIDAALRMACMETVIGKLPLGLDTDIRERGVNLSGGQKQRLALARGLYAAQDSSLLLLDEPTSSLDPVSEAMVFERLFAGRPDACIVASLHRLHLLDRFDHVYVLVQGRIVEQGSLTKLIAMNGVFGRLWQAQEKIEK